MWRSLLLLFCQLIFQTLYFTFEELVALIHFVQHFKDLFHLLAFELLFAGYWWRVRVVARCILCWFLWFKEVDLLFQPVYQRIFALNFLIFFLSYHKKIPWWFFPAQTPQPCISSASFLVTLLSTPEKRCTHWLLLRSCQSGKSSLTLQSRPCLKLIYPAWCFRSLCFCYVPDVSPLQSYLETLRICLIFVTLSLKSWRVDAVFTSTGHWTRWTSSKNRNCLCNCYS
jgi:hypothetical protein